MNHTFILIPWATAACVFSKDDYWFSSTGTLLAVIKIYILWREPSNDLIYMLSTSAGTGDLFWLVHNKGDISNYVCNESTQLSFFLSRIQNLFQFPEDYLPMDTAQLCWTNSKVGQQYFLLLVSYELAKWNEKVPLMMRKTSEERDKKNCTAMNWHSIYNWHIWLCVCVYAQQTLLHLRSCFSFECVYEWVCVYIKVWQGCCCCCVVSHVNNMFAYCCTFVLSAIRKQTPHRHTFNVHKCVCVCVYVCVCVQCVCRCAVAFQVQSARASLWCLSRCTDPTVAGW